MKCFICLQAELFDKFLHGSTIEECYSAVAAVANRWLDLLDVCELYNCVSSSESLSLKYCIDVP